MMLRNLQEALLDRDYPLVARTRVNVYPRYRYGQFGQYPQQQWQQKYIVNDA
jgi:hypothetical protein